MQARFKIVDAVLGEPKEKHYYASFSWMISNHGQMIYLPTQKVEIEGMILDVGHRAVSIGPNEIKMGNSHRYVSATEQNSQWLMAMKDRIPKALTKLYEALEFCPNGTDPSTGKPSKPQFTYSFEDDRIETVYPNKEHAKIFFQCSAILNRCTITCDGLSIHVAQYSGSCYSNKNLYLHKYGWFECMDQLLEDFSKEQVQRAFKQLAQALIDLDDSPKDAEIWEAKQVVTTVLQ